MRDYNGDLLFSASDIVNFLACRSLTALDCVNLNARLPTGDDDAMAKLLQDKGFAHESAFLKKLRDEGKRIVEIPKSPPPEERSRLTTEAMKSGADVIFQAVFHQSPWFGNADFLVRSEAPSGLGAYGYEVYDTKLARQVSPRYLVQLGLYNRLLAGIQGRLGQKVHVVLGSNAIESFIAPEIDGYLAMTMQRFSSHAAGLRSLATLDAAWQHPGLPYPVPCDKCGTCRWQEICEAKRLADDHLSQVANIRKSQIAKLAGAGIDTLTKLAALHTAAPTHIPGMAKEIQERLTHQAALQQAEKATGKQSFVLLKPFTPEAPTSAVEKTGLLLLPKPDAGDMFFDMEGDPLEDGGLEYLFGVVRDEDGKKEFKAFWAHTRAEEKLAFERFIDWAVARIKKFPAAHIYHYASYEVSAMRRLAARHATRETEVDDLLRQHRFVDLFRVVRESLLISKGSYSIKKVEEFYREKRVGDVKKADESIVVYEEWKVSQDPELLKSIEDYNREDCFSTLQLRDWLLGLAPDWIPAKAADGGSVPILADEEPRARSERSLAEEAERVPIEKRLQAFASGERTSPLADGPVFALISQLLAFYLRESKPMWWSIFERQGADLEDLLRDEDIVAACEVQSSGMEGKKHSVRFKYPQQDSKIEAGTTIKTLLSLKNGKVTALDEERHTITVGFNGEVVLAPKEHLVQCGDISTDTLRKAVIRFALSLLAEAKDYKPMLDYLNRRHPDVRGVKPGEDLLAGKPATTDNIWDVVSRMNNTTLYIQGPPGAGKTYTGAHLIAHLVKAGKKVAICSNNHKAINHLMIAAHELLCRSKHKHLALKKFSEEEQKCHRPGISDVKETGKIVAALAQLSLAGGVVWTFCNENLDQAFDYLFVDEAGQVSLANLIAMGVCARNIVLLGDQMQLGQPIQAAHPGRSGESTLDYLLDGKATIEPSRGIFLDKTFRMHPDVCGFISDCFYEGRLKPEARTAVQRLVLSGTPHPALKPTGIVLHEVPHQDNGQRSKEEAAEANSLIESLLKQRYVDHEGKEHPMTLDDILVVAPYNAQVSLLKKTLPKGSRVGTVDKFQGQEAQAVIVSMSSSNADDSPRGMGFLLDRNRLNVAVSRAKCLSIIVCSPHLLESTAKTVEDITRLNVLGHAKMATSL